VLLAIALTMLTIGCGNSEPAPDRTQTPSTSPTVTHLASLVNRDFGLVLSYDPAHYRLRSTPGTSLLELGPSPLTPIGSSQAGVSMSEEVPSLSVVFLPADSPATSSGTPEGSAAPTTAAAASPPPPTTGPATPSALQVTAPDQAAITIDVLDLPFRAPRPANGLYRWVVEQLEAEMDAGWTDTFTDPRQSVFLDRNDVPAWVLEAGGMDARGRAMHVRLMVAATPGRLYIVTVVLPADEWNAETPYIEQVLSGLELLPDGRPSRAGVVAVDQEFRFRVARPHGFVQLQTSGPEGERLYSTSISHIGGDLSTTYGVAVAAAPEGVGAQSGLLESVYRQTAENLADQPGVVNVVPPRREKVGGQRAWMIDYTHRSDDGTVLRTRHYDVWSGGFIYTLAVQGAAETWELAWNALEPVVQSFRAG